MKLTQFTNPVNGQKGDLTNLGTLWSLVLGVIVFLAVFAFGEKIFGQVNGRTGGIVGNPTDPFPPQQHTAPKTAGIQYY